VALSLQTKVGIDLEYMRPGTELAGLAERIFCARDLAAFRAVPENEAQTAFFRAWTGKEAYLKAQGTGLSGGIRNVSLSIPAGASTGRITHASEPAGGPEWRIEALPVPEGYVGSVVWNDSQKCLNFSVMDLTAST
jgi:4'-phosphopantetheinyl transferase